MLKNIIFLKYKLLSEQLRRDEVDESLAVKYLILSTIISGSVISIPIEIIPDLTEYVKANLILSVLKFIIAAIINVFGIWFLYDANNRGDGKDFFKRIVCLTFPVSLFVLLAYGIPGFFVLRLLFIDSNPFLYRIYKLVLLTIIGLLYYHLSYKCLLFISGPLIPEEDITN